MRKIKELVHKINEELEDAKDYAQDYIEAKAAGNTTKANKSQSAAEDELKHASFRHEEAVEEIEKIRAVFRPTADMDDMWTEAHKHYVEEAALIRQMLAM